ncbi:zinc transporter foi [Cimex lectularius]|uniref:Uncharacterized protein n=1 Tax=Cimex lectularius TaxID=79782 RepID=A0A8I6R702_CIMLE|nr:zinc transporter foi [Cimex lectularius]XP_014240182.1 zinc transporter foi [Cimex lectularius]
MCMGRELVTACIFCLLCTTHAHCSSHHDINNSHSVNVKYNDGGGGKLVPVSHLASVKPRHVREVKPTTSLTGISNEDYTHFVFYTFGNGEILTRGGFEKLLDSLRLSISQDTTIKQNETTNKRISKNSTTKLECGKLLPENKNEISQVDYRELCPRILYQLMPEETGGCFHRPTHKHSHHQHEDKFDDSGSTAAAWVYASISVVLISLCGLLAVAVIPLMQMSLYQGLLQFLVALAVGTLCGDALLHLLPHAMMTSHPHHHAHGQGSEEEVDQHEINLWRGLVAALSIVFFYFMEKCLSLVTEWKKKYQRKTKTNTKVRVMIEDHGNEEAEARVGEKLCKHKYSSYPYCYGEITSSTDGHRVGGESEINNISKMRDENGTAKIQEVGVQEDVDTHKEDAPGSEKQLLETPSDVHSDYTTIILREHETRHHGHAHTHGHVHSAPESLGSVAWMVVMGDGIHNLTDGLAIGAAFAANIGGGVSTAVAVFCHELPHEIGDFAVLLKAGMSAKQAVFYNMLSSFLCFFGMSIGIVLGHNDHVKLWVFSAAAGMFLYIALVDMIPELTSSHSKEGGSLCQCLLQLVGLLTGIGIMLLIAHYESNLMTSFQNKF